MALINPVPSASAAASKSVLKWWERRRVIDQLLLPE